MNNDPCDLIQRGAANFRTILRYFQKATVTCQMAAICRDIDDLIHITPQYL